jgi:hypothetical protein
MSYLLLYSIMHIICAICSSLISEHIDDDGNIFFSILVGPIALFYYSGMIYELNKSPCNCVLCGKRRANYKFFCCKKCIKKHNIKNKHEIAYYQREQEIADKIAKEKVEMRIQVMEDLYSGGSDEDAKNQETIFRRKE